MLGANLRLHITISNLAPCAKAPIEPCAKAPKICVIGASPDPGQAIACSRATLPKKTNSGWKLFAGAALSGLLIAIASFSATATSSDRQNIELKVGVVQRFGSSISDRLTLKAVEPGDRLTLTFEGGDGKPTTLMATEIKLEISTRPLQQSLVEERVVLSTHRSFENAENSANRWQQQGLEVEIGQPSSWQVWAKRDTYNSPLLRRLLLESLREAGNKTAFIETYNLRQERIVSWVAGGNRYHRKYLDISASQDLIAVSHGKGDRNKRSYHGRLEIKPNAYGSYTLVNQVPLETYLRGVVPHEVGTDPPYAALESQTILARTYALRNLRRFQIDGYQLCANTHCQVYKGADTWIPADRAIAATAGQVLTYQNELVDALYFSTSGGITASFEDLWDGPPRPYLLPVVDSATNIWNLSGNSLAGEQNFRRFMALKQGFNEEKHDFFRWREASGLPQMNQRLRGYLQRKKHPLANFKTIRKLEVVERSKAGRVLKLAVTTDRGIVELKKDEILQGFYAPLSTLFYLEPMYGADKTLKGYRFVGGGFGHGVGLSQHGSHFLAKLGWSSDRILRFYFPGTEIQTLNEDITF